MSSKQEWDDDVGSHCSHPTCWRRQGNSAVLSICHSIWRGERLGRPRLGYFVRFAFRLFRLLILVLFILAHRAADSVVLPYLYWRARCTKQIKGLYQLWVVAESEIRKKRKETPRPAGVGYPQSVTILSRRGMSSRTVVCIASSLSQDEHTYVGTCT